MTRVPCVFLASGQSAPFATGVTAVGGLEVVADLVEDGGGLRLDWSLRNGGRRAVWARRVGVGVPSLPRQVIEHGWQSWSVVRTCDPLDVRPERRHMPGWRRAMYLLDGHGAGHVVAGDQFLVDDAGVTGFLGARHGFGTVVAQPDGGLVAWALLDGVAIRPGESRPLDSLWLASGDPGPTYAEYARRWGEEASARASTPAPFGWCSWYRFGTTVTPEDVRRQLRPARSHGVEVVQIDDGWQVQIGDWDTFSPAWADGVAPVAGEIRAAGLRAGIWTAPFLAAETSAVATRHPEWLLRDHRGRPIRAMDHATLWGGWAVALDTTHPGVLDHLHATYARLVDEGFDVHKLDFLYAGALPGRRRDRSVTRAEALRRGLDAVRSGTGDRAFLLGCGCPLGPAVGVVDAMRVSPDTSICWAQPAEVPGLDEAAPSAANAVRTSLLRAPLHRRLWINDPDCLILRHPLESRTPAQQRLIVETVARTGCYTTLSDDLAEYGPADWQAVARVRSRLPGADAPLALVDPFAAEPAVVPAAPPRPQSAA
ncbi:MAG TPA: glycoside hydrolase family 36 protein [Acidimicrobiales bacterium]|nr:glycoside hydrolase family 36 protein [Acidimicrobiales bacterium]